VTAAQKDVLGFERSEGGSVLLERPDCPRGSIQEFPHLGFLRRLRRSKLLGKALREDAADAQEPRWFSGPDAAAIPAQWRAGATTTYLQVLIGLTRKVPENELRKPYPPAFRPRARHDDRRAITLYVRGPLLVPSCRYLGSQPVEPFPVGKPAIWVGRRKSGKPLFFTAPFCIGP
jgi:hypothetical protein